MTEFDTPQSLFKEAKKLILHQDDALKQLCVLMYYHLKQSNLHNKKAASHDIAEFLRMPELSSMSEAIEVSSIKQPPIFLIGKTGSGKTHLVKELCQLIGVNFACVNCTHLSNSGYKGMNIADIGRQLAKTATNETALAHSVVFLDEFDKLFVGSEVSSNYVEFNRMLSAELLTLIEGTTPFPIRGDGDKDEQHIESKQMLFILGGSFGMHGSKKPPMGFMAKTDNPKDLPESQNTLTDFGLPAELAGRIGKIISMQTMNHAMMKDILRYSPTSPYCSFCGQLALEYCTSELDDGVLDGLIETQATAIEKFGVRGLYQGFYELPQILEILMDAPLHRHHHYTIKADGFTKEHRPPPPPPAQQITEPKPEENLPRVTEFLYDDDMPF